MFLLDTNHCSALIAGNPHIRTRIVALDETDLSTSVIVRGELLYMALRSERRTENLATITAFLRDITTYHVDYAVARRYAELKSSLFDHFGPRERAKRRHVTTRQLGFDENDLWIAATAMRFGLTLVSSDRDFVRIAEVIDLQHESWLGTAKHGA